MKSTETIFRAGIMAAAVLSLAAVASIAMPPNPLISRGRTVKASNGTAAALVDGKYGAGAFTFSANSWFAIDVGAGPTSIFISWNTTSYTWSDMIADPGRADCKQTPSYPVNYTIQTSANSTDGADGDWTTVTTVIGNNVTARGHDIDFTGMRWVKMAIASSNRTNDKIDEVEVFNTSDGAEDTWFFAGTSISANAFKSFPTLKSFPTWVNEVHSDYYPAMIRGGIPCITSTHFARDISMYLKAAGSCHYWAIEMGTNDAWGGADANVATFKTNLKLVIDSCRAHGIEPIIANVLATDSTKAGWQVNPGYAKAVSDLTESNDLIEGPDYFAAFKENPTFLNGDGVHPSNKGGAAMHQLWAEKMDGLFKPSGVNSASPEPLRCAPFRSSTVKVSGSRRLLLSVKDPGTLSVFTLNGQLLQRVILQTAGDITLARPDGCAVLQLKTVRGNTVVRLLDVGAPW
ncbi:MAG: hypothetical protein JXA18_15470 [Chitinispirillaceae bacterium]|nr:hypothetical protein [Chitinispirillaceae bacterium]